MSAPVPDAIGVRPALQEARLRLESSLARFAGQALHATELISGASRLAAQLAALPLAEEERGSALQRAVLSSPTAAASPIARELRASVTHSGLFYEAHLRAWNSGELPLEDLRREPQARYGERIADEAARADSAPGPKIDWNQPPSPVPRELERLVREQLATLETKTAVVPLALWPGQEATLSIGREEERSAPEARRGSRAWRATLALRLPRLGEVRLTVAVHDELVSVRAEAPAAQSRRTLAAQAGALQAALQRNALVLERMELADDER
jgi:hypothetical protein